MMILHQPPSPTHPPVLYYIVTHNVSDNGSELAFRTTTNEVVLNEAKINMETYYISVCANNAIGKNFHISKMVILNRHYVIFFSQHAAIDPALTTTVVLPKTCGC